MNVRLNTLWRVPVFYLCASWISFYLTVYLGSFYLVKTTGADGVTEVSIDPIRSAILDLVLLLAVLLLGGLWACRGMTKLEIFFSAIIVFVPFLIINRSPFLLEIPMSLRVIFDKLNYLSNLVYSPLVLLTDNFNFSVLISDFTPFLYIPFGRKLPTKANL